MDEYLGTRAVDISENLLKKADFGNMSSISRDIIKNSGAFYKASILSPSKSKYRHAAYHLSKNFFDIKD